MSTKYIGKGWGDLNGRLTAWHCPKCGIDSLVGEWEIVLPSAPFNMEGRKCPLCDFQAFQHGDTMRMVPESHRPPRDVDSEIKIPRKRKRK